MLEFIPETLEQLQKRYPDAVLETYIPAPGMKDTPGTKREHVFDCEEGFRLIISKDLYGDKEFIHFSGSYFKNMPATLQASLDLIEEKFYSISGNKTKATFIGFTPDKNIPHWMIEVK